MSDWMAWTLFIVAIVACFLIPAVLSGRKGSDGLMDRVFNGRSDHDTEAVRAQAHSHNQSHDGWGGPFG
jgi:hypothetical protein